jgi:hypothetical protein
MWRRLKQLAIAVSLLLFVASSVIWLRSYWRSDAVVYNGHDGHRAVQWAAGIVIAGSDNVGSPRRSLGLDSWSYDGTDVRIGSGFWGRRGFAHDLTVTPATSLSAASLASFPTAPPGTILSRRVSMPVWPMVALSLVLPARAGLIVLRRRQRRRTMRCIACGYDVRASHERCPECGTTIANVQPAAT